MSKKYYVTGITREEAKSTENAYIEKKNYFMFFCLSPENDEIFGLFLRSNLCQISANRNCGECVLLLLSDDECLLYVNGEEEVETREKMLEMFKLHGIENFHDEPNFPKSKVPITADQLTLLYALFTQEERAAVVDRMREAGLYENGELTTAGQEAALRVLETLRLEVTK